MRYYYVNYKANKIIAVEYQPGQRPTVRPENVYTWFSEAQKALVNFNLNHLRAASKLMAKWDTRMAEAITLAEPPRESASTRRRRARQSD